MDGQVLDGMRGRCDLRWAAVWPRAAVLIIKPRRQQRLLVLEQQEHQPALFKAGLGPEGAKSEAEAAAEEEDQRPHGSSRSGPRLSTDH